MTTEWKDGLPPVGEECEIKLANDWIRADCVGYWHTYAVLVSDSDLPYIRSRIHIRPLKSDEDRAVEAMVREIIRLRDNDDMALEWSIVCRDLYQMGYRKV